MRVALATPCHRAVMPPTARALKHLASALTANGITHDEVEQDGNGDIALARNDVIAGFLRSAADRLLFVDDDVSFPWSGALRLITSNLDYVGANYPMKRIGGGWASTPLEGGLISGACVEADMLATGLLSISRAAAQKLAAASVPYLTHDGHTAFEICRTGVLGGRWASEDAHMCRLWQSLGGIAWIDTTVECDHVGMMTFTKETA